MPTAKKEANGMTRSLCSFLISEVCLGAAALSDLWAFCSAFYLVRSVKVLLSHN